MIRNCPKLKQIIFDGAVADGSAYKIEIEDLPSLESIIVYDEETSVNVQKYRSESSAITSVQTKYHPSCIIYGSAKNQALRSYCQENEITFMPFTISADEPHETGDITGDQVIDILDVISVNKVMFGKTTLSEEQRKAADVNNDGEVDATDSLLIMKYIVRLIDSFE